MTPITRGHPLWQVGELPERRIDVFREIETFDQGKSFYIRRWAEIPGAVEQLRFFAAKVNGSSQRKSGCLD
jgi:acyl-CoA reductase-like NAD-dependent aldehyde dehydrogenase